MVVFRTLVKTAIAFKSSSPESGSSSQSSQEQESQQSDNLKNESTPLVSTGVFSKTRIDKSDSKRMAWKQTLQEKLQSNRSNNPNDPEKNQERIAFGTSPLKKIQRIGFTDTGQEFTDIGDSSMIVRLAFYHILIYYCIAIVGYSFLFESWSIIDSVYFATVVLTTVGYGGIVPTNQGSEYFTIIFAFYGICILGGLISMLFAYINRYYDEAMDTAISNARIQIMENYKSHASSKINLESKDTTTSEAIIKEHQNESKQEFEKPFWKAILEVLLQEIPLIFILLVLTILISIFEKWSLSTSIYWLFITGTTIGFGDFIPTQDASKLVCIIYLPLCIIIIGDVITEIATMYIDRKQSKLENTYLSRSLTMNDLTKIDTNHDGRVSQYEFLKFMLIALHKVEQEDIDVIDDVFHKLDVTGNGYLDQRDILPMKTNRDEEEGG